MTFSQMLEALRESTTSVPLAFFWAQHMTHKWPFNDHDQYLDRPLVEIRREFAIELIE